MKKIFSAFFVLLLILALTPESYNDRAIGGSMEQKMLSHDVFFTLKDSSGPAKQKLVEACKKYLSKHDGTEFFSAGVRAEDFKREVNDQDFDVALHVVFRDMASHDKYQEHARHLRFIEENKENWAKVRVFDSIVEN